MEVNLQEKSFSYVYTIIIQNESSKICLYHLSLIITVYKKLPISNSEVEAISSKLD